MKERPILMQTDNVRAILEGRKTQTRRVIGIPFDEKPIYTSQVKWPDLGNFEVHTKDKSFSGYSYKCPYGQVGDRLWVRESFLIDHYEKLFYKAGKVFHPEFYKWKSSIFMPRWASRITLEITEIRVERLQEISREDCIKEGIERHLYMPAGEYERQNFAFLWDSINGKKYPWESNPWVWVVAFRVL